MSKLTTGIAIAGLLSPVGAHALGVGEIRLQSYLNQALRAEIPLVLSQEKLSDLKIQLAPAKDFAAAGLERSYILTKLRFEPAQQPGGGYVIRVGSTESIHEPFLSFLVEVTWPEGRMVRNFTVLLDPPDVLAAPSAPTRSSRFPDIDNSASDLPAPQIGATVAAVPPSASEYGPVGRNEKLWTIAGKLNQDPEITQEQMVIALFRFNPQAFSRPSVNALNAGALLRVPPRDYLLQISPSLAREEFFRQQAGRAPRRLPEAPTGLNDQSLTPHAEPGDIVNPLPPSPRARPAPGVQSDAGLRALEALQRDNAEMRTRLADLEKRVTELQALISNKEMLAAPGPSPATLENKPSSESEATRSKGLSAQAPVATPLPGAAVPDSPPAAGATSAASATSTGPDPHTVDARPSTPPDTRSAAAPVRSAPSVTTASGAAAGAAAESHAGVWLLAGAGTALASWSAWFYLRRARKTKLSAETDRLGTPKPVSDPSVNEGVFSNDTAEPDRLITGDPQSPLHDSDDVDPIFEADIYLSYGKFDQAAEAMEHAIRKHPEREAYRLKLLEIHLVRGDTQRFEDNVRLLKSSQPAPGPAFWNRVNELAGRLHTGSSPDMATAQPENTARPADETDRLINDLKRFSIEMRGDPSKAVAEPQTPDLPPAHNPPARLDPPPADDGHEIPWVPVSVNVEPARPSTTPTETATTPAAEPDEHLLQFVPESSSAKTSPPNAEEAMASESIDSLLKELSALHYERHCQEDHADETAAVARADAPEQPGAAPQATAAAAAKRENAADAPSGSASIVQGGDPATDLETKLDLARAYADMGDPEQAREFLSEVMEHGTEAQKTEAAGLLATLAGA